MAAPPSIPPTCKILMSVSKNAVPTAQLPFPKRTPRNLLNPSMGVMPVRMACLPNSNWIATLTRQLTRMTQKVMKPPFAPSTVVAMSSPEPTMEAERMKPGPRKRSLPLREMGGSLMPGCDISNFMNVKQMA